MQTTRSKRIVVCCVLVFTLCFFFNIPTAYGQVLRPTNTGGLSSVTRGGTGTSSSAPGGQNNSPFPNSDTTSRIDTSAVKGLVFHTETPDSVLRQKVFLFHYRPTHIWIDKVWNPSLDPTGVQLSEPLDALNGNYYLGKGSLGHPHVATFPILSNGLGIHLQPDIYEGYYMTDKNIDFYQTLTPYTVLSYGSSLNKDYNVRVSHTQNILPGWNVAFTYRLFNPEGTFAYSGASNHYLNANTNYFSKDSRMQLAAGIIRHSFTIDENGGIAYDSIFSQGLQSNLNGIPVNINNAASTQKDLTAFGRLTYSLTRQSTLYRHRDSIAAHMVNDSVTVYDTVDITDTIALRTPKVFNAGVIGLALNHDRRKRVFGDSTLWREQSFSLFWSNDAYPTHRWHNPMKVTLGISPRRITAVIAGDTMQYATLLNPFARTEVKIWKAILDIEAERRVNPLSQNRNDSRVEASLQIPFDSTGMSFLNLSAVNQLQGIDLHLVHDYNGTLRSIASQRYTLQLKHKEIINFNLTANHLSHNTWYDTSLNVIEGNHALWLLQAALTLRLSVGPLHLDMQQLVQHTTDANQIPVPLWSSKNSLYADFYLFHRTLRAQVGTDVRYHTAYHAPLYDPYSGLFLHQDEYNIGNYIWADLFVNMQVKRASIYIKAGHVNAIWETQPNYFLLPHYPGQNFGVFWGMNWVFFD